MYPNFVVKQEYESNLRMDGFPDSEDCIYLKIILQLTTKSKNVSQLVRNSVNIKFNRI